MRLVWRLGVRARSDVTFGGLAEFVALHFATVRRSNVAMLARAGGEIDPRNR